MPSRPAPLVVAIAGGSASGKTTLARALVEALAPDAALISLDRFYEDLGHLPAASRARVNFDRPARIDWPRFLRVLDTLRRGRAAALPVYDFGTHTRASRTERQEPARFLVLDGLWLLRRREVRARSTLRLFVDCPEAERLRRRIRRDVRERGRDRREVIERWTRFVEPAFRRFVAPQIRRADRVLRSPVPPSTIAALAAALRRESGDPAASGGRRTGARRRLDGHPFPRAARRNPG